MANQRKGQPKQHYQNAEKPSVDSSSRAKYAANHNNTIAKKPFSTKTNQKPKPRALLKRQQPYVGSDNHGEAAWRAQEPPVDHIDIPAELVYKTSGPNKSRAYMAIARLHSVHLFVISTKTPEKSNQTTKRFGIWGYKSNVDEAKRALEAWIKASHRENYGAARFAKIVPMKSAAIEQQEKQWRQDVRRQAYRQRPPANIAFAAVGSFHWPVDICDPQDVLGSNLEALDPIRMSHSCYISLNEGGNLIQVSSEEKASDVEKALVRIRSTFLQLRARDWEPVTRYHVIQRRLNGPEHGHRGTEVVMLQSYSGETSLSENSTAATQIVPQLRRTKGWDWDDTSMLEKLEPSFLSTLKNDLISVLCNLQYYRGYITLRLRLGVFIATQYKKPKSGGWRLDEFKRMTEQSQFNGYITQELGDTDAEKTLPGALHPAPDILMPAGSSISDLADVLPSFDATFDLADVDRNIYRLQIHWQAIRNEPELSELIRYDRVAERWTRFDHGNSSPTELLSSNLIDLAKPCAWQIDLTASNSVDHTRLASELISFAESVTLTPCEPSDSGSWNLLHWQKYTGVYVLKAITQRRVYTYDFIHSDYTLEIAQFQSQKSKGPGALSASAITADPPRWSVNLHRREWDATLSQNERLQVGKKVNWSDQVEKWFPSSVAPAQSSEKAAGDCGTLLEGGFASMLDNMVVTQHLVMPDSHMRNHP